MPLGNQNSLCPCTWNITQLRCLHFRVDGLTLLQYAFLSSNICFYAFVLMCYTLVTTYLMFKNTITQPKSCPPRWLFFVLSRDTIIKKIPLEEIVQIIVQFLRKLATMKIQLINIAYTHIISALIACCNIMTNNNMLKWIYVWENYP